MTLTIEITSDYICPWCYVAEDRLKQAIAQFTAEHPTPDIQMVWHPFELNPNMPIPGIDRKTYRSNKFGSWAYSQQLDDQTIQATQGDNVEFRYDLMDITPNTFNAHRLTWFAAQQGQATTMAERILKAYFTEGRNIGDADTLGELAGDIGLDQDAMNSFLRSNSGTQTIRELERQAIAQGIRGVPHIRIGEQRLTGAQAPGTFLQALQNAIQAPAP